MAENAGARFYEGLRVTADHLRHSQDRLWEAVGDLRLALGRGKIAWGLKAEIANGSLTLSPGVAFSSEGVRLALDTETLLSVPPDTGPLLLRLTPVNEDRASLQLGGVPTYITLRAEATLVEEDGASDAPETLDIARVVAGPVSEETTETVPTVSQTPEMFIVAGHHGHSGTFLQDDTGRWFYDGPVLPDIAVLAEQLEMIDEILSGIDDRLVPLEALPALLAALQDEALIDADLEPLADQLADLQPLLDSLSALQELAAIAADLQAQAAVSGQLETLVGMLPDLRQVPGLIARINDLDGIETGIEASIKALEERVRALEQAEPSEGTGDGTASGLDPGWPRIKGTNWPHGQVLSLERAFEQLTGIVLSFSQPLAPSSLETGGQALQVWFEPDGAIDNRPIFQPILALSGQAKATERDQITWATTGRFDDTVSAMKAGGRVILRVHCGALLSDDGRAFSASTAGFTDIPKPPVPGGLLESWFFVKGG